MLNLLKAIKNLLFGPELKHLVLYFRKIFNFNSVLIVNDANWSLYILGKLLKAMQSYVFFSTTLSGHLIFNSLFSIALVLSLRVLGIKEGRAESAP